MPAEFDPERALRVLVRHGVDFVLIGGLAGIAHGSAYNTDSVEVAYRRDPDNLVRLTAALSELEAGTRPDLEGAANLTVETSVGQLDARGEPAGAPPYKALLRASSTHTIAGVPVRVASIDHLIAMREAARPAKEKLLAMELRVISDELRAPRGDSD